MHKNQIVWSDVKADIFIADAINELSIIGFSGSHTERLGGSYISETKDGDKQELEKMQAALKPPRNGTLDLDYAAKENMTETTSFLFVSERKKDTYSEPEGKEEKVRINARLDVKEREKERKGAAYS